MNADPENANQNWDTVRKAMEYLNRDHKGIVCGGWITWASARLGDSRVCFVPGKGRTSFAGYDLTRFELAGVAMRGAILKGAIMVGAELSNATLHEADLSSVILRGAKLRDAELIGADLAHAVLVGTDLSRADLRGVQNLRQEQLDRACSDRDDGPRNIPSGRMWNERVCDSSQ